VNTGPASPQSFELGAGATVRQHVWRRNATRVTLDREGIRVDYGPSASRVLRWDDPKLQFALLDFREAEHNQPPWVRRPKQFEFRFRPELGMSGFAIPEVLFRALMAAAGSAGLLLGPGMTGGGIPAGTKVYHYARRRPRWWS